MKECWRAAKWVLCFNSPSIRRCYSSPLYLWNTVHSEPSTRKSDLMLIYYRRLKWLPALSDRHKTDCPTHFDVMSSFFAPPNLVMSLAENHLKMERRQIMERWRRRRRRQNIGLEIGNDNARSCIFRLIWVSTQCAQI